MTTILMKETKNGVEIAYDSQCTAFESFELEREKVFTNANGVIFGVAGLLLLNAELKHAQLPSIPQDPAMTEKWMVKTLLPHLRRLFDEVLPRRQGDMINMSILAVVHNKVYEIGCDTSIGRRVDGMYAIGSGGTLALGAMKHGASLGEALEIAAGSDPYTGGRLTVTSARKLLNTTVSV